MSRSPDDTIQIPAGRCPQGHALAPDQHDCEVCVEHVLATLDNPTNLIRARELDASPLAERSKTLLHSGAPGLPEARPRSYQEHDTESARAGAQVLLADVSTVVAAPDASTPPPTNAAALSAHPSSLPTLISASASPSSSSAFISPPSASNSSPTYDRHSDPVDARSFGFAKADIEFSQAGFPRTGVRLAERYAILAKVAEGGMGVIFLVMERISGRAVALKVMKESATGDQSLVQQFIREAVITARLQHPGIVPVYEIGFLTGDELYYTMRYVEGASFSHYLRERTFSVADRLQVLRQAALGVHHAHVEGLWHRDIKPENILVGKHGEVHVIDWGLVSVDPRQSNRYKLKLPRLRLRDRTLDFEGVDLLLDRTEHALTTQTGLFAGTPQYMSPEQLVRHDSAMGPRSDIWSFGVMLYEALAERHPFGPSTEHQIVLIEAIKNGSPPDLHALAPSAPPRLIALCNKMLEKDPEKRLSSLAEFVGELDSSRVLSGEPMTILPSTMATSSAPHIANILLDNHHQREEIALLRQLAQTGSLRWRTRRDLWRRLRKLHEQHALAVRPS